MIYAESSEVCISGDVCEGVPPPLCLSVAKYLCIYLRVWYFIIDWNGKLLTHWSSWFTAQ